MLTNYKELKDKLKSNLFLASLAIAICYFIAARLSLMLAYEGSNASPIWPPSGIAIASIYIIGFRVAPAIAIAAFIANILSLMTGEGVNLNSTLVSLAIALGNTAEAILATVLLRRTLLNASPFANPQNVFKFLIVVTLACAVAASIGTFSLYAGSLISASIAPAVWLNWWLGDVGGVMVVTPLILAWLPALKQQLTKRTVLEVLMTSLLVCIITVAIFSGYFANNHIDRVLVYLSILAIAWIAYRFGLAEVTLAILVFTAGAIWATIHHLGPFSTVELNDSLILLVSFIIMLALTGLLLSADIVHRYQTLTTQRKLPRLEWTTLLSLLGMTIISWHLASLETAKLSESQFALSINQVQLRIQQRMKIYEEVLKGGVALYAASDNITHDDWYAYCETLDLQESLPGILGFGYAQMLKSSEKDAFVNEMRAVKPDYEVKPSGHREYYGAIKYLEPEDERNIEAIGYDMYSEASRQLAMKTAALSGEMSLSKKITLVQEIDEDVQAGILMYLPQYKKGVKLNTTAQRWKALEGFVYAPFRMQNLLNGILSSTLVDIRLQLFDGDSTRPDDLMYDSHADLPMQTDVLGSLARKTLFDIGGHAWTLSFQTLPSFNERVDQQKAQIILLSGLLLSLLLYMLVRSLSVNREAALNLAKEMASALRGSEEKFKSLTDSSNTGIVVTNSDEEIIYCNHAITLIFGYSDDETLGQDFAFLMGGATKGQHKKGEKVSFNLSQYVGKQFDDTGMNKANQAIPINCSVSQWEDQGEWFYGIAIQDITERKLAETNLKSLASRLKLATEAAEAGVWELDATTKTMKWDKKMFKMHDLKLEPDPNINVYDDWLSTIDASYRKGVLSQIKASLDHATSFKSEWKSINGRVFRSFGLISHSEKDNAPLLVGIDFDITEQRNQELKIKNALEEKETLLKEVYHRVKNNLQVITSLFNLQSRSLPDGESKNVIADASSRVFSMSLVHEKLYRSKELSSIQLNEYIQDLCINFSQASGLSSKNIKFQLSVQPLSVDLDTAIPLGLILNELISNCLKHAFKNQTEGVISITLNNTNDHKVELTVSDNGQNDLVNTPPNGKTLGLQLINSLCNQLDGEIHQEINNGTTVRITFKEKTLQSSY